MSTLIEILDLCKKSLKVLNLAENDLRGASASYSGSEESAHFGFIESLELVYLGDGSQSYPLFSLDLRGTCLVQMPASHLDKEVPNLKRILEFKHHFDLQNASQTNLNLKIIKDELYTFQSDTMLHHRKYLSNLPAFGSSESHQADGQTIFENMTTRYLVVDSIKVNSGSAFEVVDYKSTFDDEALDDQTFRKVMILSPNSFAEPLQKTEAILSFADRYLKVIKVGWWEDVARH